MSMAETIAPTRSGMMQVMDPSGHTEVTWDSDVPAEVEVARAAFRQLTEDKGYQAFRVRNGGERGERMRTFDASAEKILMIPQLVGG